MNQLFKNKISKLNLIISVLLIRIMIDIAYERIIYPLYEYAGFSNNRSFETEIISWIVFFASILFICGVNSIGEDRASATVFMFLYFMSFLPFTTCLKYGMFNNNYVIFAIVFWAVMFMAEMLNIYTKVKPFPILVFDNKIANQYIVFIISVFSCFFTILLCYKYTGLRIHLNLLTVYDLREEATGYAMSASMEYIFGWTRAINPFMLVYCYLNRKRIYAFIFAICSLLNFGFDGSKTALFFPVLFIIIAFLCQQKKMNLQRLIVHGLLLVVILCLVEYGVSGTNYLCSYFIRRTMMVENLNNAYYFDFFTNNMPDFFRASILRIFGFHTPYLGIAKTIGLLYQGRDTNANCGLIADAMTNFGILGVFAYPFLIFVLMRILDRITSGKDCILKAIVALYIALHLINSFLITSLISHGIVFMLLLVYLSQPSEDKKVLEFISFQGKQNVTA